MKTSAQWLFSGIGLVSLVALAACQAVLPQVAAVQPQPTATATLLPPFIATPQAAQSQAQATIAAAQAAQVEANLAQAYLLVTQTAVSMAQSQAAATEAYFARQTEQVVAATAAAQSAYATATQQTRWAESTASQEAIWSQATATAQAEAILAVHATDTASVRQTAAAWPLTATPLSATQIAIVAQVQETERRTYWRQFVIPFWVLIGAVCLATFLVLVVLAYQRLMPVLELWLRTRHSSDGETLILLEKDQGIHILQPGRNFGAALLNRPEGVMVDAIAPAGAEWQDRVVGREQAIRLAHALPEHRKTSAQQLLAPMNLPHLPPATDTPHIEIVEAERIRPWLDEVKTRLLSSGEEIL